MVHDHPTSLYLYCLTVIFSAVFPIKGFTEPVNKFSEKDAVSIVQHQIDAYNAHDFEQFIAPYSSSIVLRDIHGRVLVSGLDELKARYEKRFDQTLYPNQHVDILNRMVLGNFIIDREHVTGLPGNEPVEAIAIYEVKDGYIQQAWFISPKLPE